MYREKYGTTTWTRIEEEAIRDRAYDNGYEFTLYISLDKKVPKYLPRTRIWFNLEKYGTKGAATVISYKISEQGGETNEYSAKDKAEKLKRKLEFKRKVENYKQSPEAIEESFSEIDKLFEIAEEKVNEIFSGLNKGFVKEDRHFFRLRYERLALEVVWTRFYNNSLDRSSLKFNYYVYSEKLIKPSLKTDYEYEFYKNFNWENVWKLIDNENTNYKTEFLIEKHLKEFIEIVEKEDFGDENDIQSFFI